METCREAISVLAANDLLYHAQVAHCFLLRNAKESIRKPVASRQLPTPGHVGVLGNQRQRAHVSTPRPRTRNKSGARLVVRPHHPTGPGARGAASQPRASTSRIALLALGSTGQPQQLSFDPFPPPSLSPPREASSPRPCDSISILSVRSQLQNQNGRGADPHAREGRHTDRTAAAAFKSRGGLPCRRGAHSHSPAPQQYVHRDLAFVAPCRAGGRAWGR